MKETKYGFQSQRYCDKDVYQYYEEFWIHSYEMYCISSKSLICNTEVKYSNTPAKCRDFCNNVIPAQRHMQNGKISNRGTTSSSNNAYQEESQKWCLVWSPKEILDFQILLVLYLYFITLTTYSTISLRNLFPIYSRIHDFGLVFSIDC